MITENNTTPQVYTTRPSDNVQWQGRPVKTVKRGDFITKVVGDLLDLFRQLFGGNDDPAHNQFTTEYTNEYL